MFETWKVYPVDDIAFSHQPKGMFLKLCFCKHFSKCPSLYLYLWEAIWKTNMVFLGVLVSGAQKYLLNE